MKRRLRYGLLLLLAALESACATCGDSIRFEAINLDTEPLYLVSVQIDDFNPYVVSTVPFKPGENGAIQFHACDLQIRHWRHARVVVRTLDGRERVHTFEVVHPDSAAVARKYGVSRRDLIWHLFLGFGFREEAVGYAWTVEKFPRSDDEIFHEPRTLYFYGGNKVELLLNPKLGFTLTEEELRQIPRYPAQ